MKDVKIKEIAIINGIGFKYMTNYRAMLVHLRNEKFTAQEIANKLNGISKDIKVSSLIVDTWFNRGTQPKDEIIEILEELLSQKIFESVKKARNPEYSKY